MLTLIQMMCYYVLLDYLGYNCLCLLSNKDFIISSFFFLISQKVQFIAS